MLGATAPPDSETIPKRWKRRKTATFAECPRRAAIGQLRTYTLTSARVSRNCPIPRTVSRFFTHYQVHIIYGNDMNADPEMNRVTFRLLETKDEHSYPACFRKYHWPKHARALPDGVLKKIYRENALQILPATSTSSETSLRAKSLDESPHTSIEGRKQPVQKHPFVP